MLLVITSLCTLYNRPKKIMGVYNINNQKLTANG